MEFDFTSWHMWVVVVMDVRCNDGNQVDLIGALHASLQRLSGQGLLKGSGALGENKECVSFHSSLSLPLPLSHLILFALK